jgi:ribosomal protein S6--L-glutamate ligase
VSLINDAAEQAGVQIRWLSDDWVAKLAREDEVHYLHGASFPLNNVGASQIAADKVATFRVLNDAGVPAVPHHLVRFPYSGQMQGVVDFALKLVQPPMVVKPINEAGGLDVCKADTVEEAVRTINRLAARYYVLAISPFETIVSEHRVVVLDGSPRLFYEKKLTNLDEWRHNLRHGAVALSEESPQTIAALSDMAVRAMHAIDARFMSVDIIHTTSGLKVIEINSGVMLDRFAGLNENYRARVVSIYRDAIRLCFGA